MPLFTKTKILLTGTEKKYLCNSHESRPGNMPEILAINFYTLTR